MSTRAHRQHLLFDADDTLWENNVYFERGIEEFLDFLDHSTLTRAEARAALDEIERANASIHGYGALAFAQSLKDCAVHLAERHLDEAEIAAVMRFGQRILEQDIELISGVAETLAVLATRHDLTIVTKGNLAEQRLKIDRSGIADIFGHHEIVPEKTEHTYRSLVDHLGIDPERTWMIGNSPKSDINPALAIGIGAVYIPHDQTWKMEHADIAHSSNRLITLRRFPELLDCF